MSNINTKKPLKGSQLNAAVARIAELQTAIEEQKSTKQAADAQLKRLNAEQVEVFTLVSDYLQSLHDFRAGWSERLASGTLSVKENPPTIVVSDADAALKWLAANAPGCIKTTTDIDKNALRGDPNFIIDVPGIDSLRLMQIDVTPLTGKKISFKIEHTIPQP
ncbi:MAG: host-nuclease inhibitor Gam family protein [Rhodothermia bacterium]|nr:host-nuclease inhibitor Gam family protein [Rhodothermia bacterium]